MFNSKIVFIVGAGASQEVGLPTGKQLKAQIAEKLNITYISGIDLTSPDTGDGEIARALVEDARNMGDIHPYLVEAGKIRDAMPQAISIDNFIDTHSANRRLVLCGKLGIIQAIRDAERHSKLYVENKPGTIQRKFDLTKIEDTWYGKFFKLLSENVKLADVSSIFANVAFIVFNYDRCIEHYLYHAMQNYFAISNHEAQKILSTLNIMHPYGVIGALPWQNSVSNIEFGEERKSAKLLDNAADIMTYVERIEDETALALMHKLIGDAEVVVFLGFGFHRLNLQLLSLETRGQTKLVLGTVLGISGSDIGIIRDEVVRMLKCESGVLLSWHNNGCSNLFDEFWRTLTSALSIKGRPGH
jgi:hypothetical protein